MAYRNPAFYFYHGAREALSVTGVSPASDETSALFDGRQGEVYIFGQDFTAGVSGIRVTRDDTPEANAISHLIVAGHNWNLAEISVFTNPTFEDMLDPNYSVTEANGTLISIPLDPVAVLPDNEIIRVQVSIGTAPGSVVPEWTECFLTTKREMSRGPDPEWEHPWLRQQTQFTNEAGVTSTWLKGAARKRFRMTWHALEGADRQILFDLQAQTNDWSEPFYFEPPDDTYPLLLVELARDADWQQDFPAPLGTGTTDEVTLDLIEVLG